MSNSSYSNECAMNENELKSPRFVVGAIEVLLLMATIAVMWSHPFGDSISIVLGSVLTIIFLSLLPVLFKGDSAAKRESDFVKREFSGEDERDKFRKR